MDEAATGRLVPDYGNGALIMTTIKELRRALKAYKGDTEVAGTIQLVEEIPYEQMGRGKTILKPFLEFDVVSLDAVALDKMKAFDALRNT